MEKNKFIRELSREQFDGVMTNKNKKLLLDYFEGNLSDNELLDKFNKNLELVDIYTTGENTKIDANQYLYNGLVEVALFYYNNAGSYESVFNKACLFSSYFQLVASADVKLQFMDSLLEDVIYLQEHITDTGFLDKKIKLLSDNASSVQELIIEIGKHEDVILKVENEVGTDFVDEVLFEDSMKELYEKFRLVAGEVTEHWFALLDDCSDKSIDIKITGGA